MYFIGVLSTPGESPSHSFIFGIRQASVQPISPELTLGGSIVLQVRGNNVFQTLG